VHIIEGAGHLPQIEKSGEVNRLIEAFVAAHPQKRGSPPGVPVNPVAIP
jgi:hypothetical protein